MANRFTQNQLRAVTERGNIIVSAGAGSGKTTVMIARIIDKLKKGASLNEMLIVTFTRASAADMRVKLTEELIRLKRSGEFAGAGEAIECMSVCNIGTLHSYCQKLIRNYFYVADIDPSAAVCEEGEAKILKRAAVAAAVDAALGEGCDGGCFGELYGMLRTRRSDDGVIGAITDVLDFALSVANPEGFLTDIKPDSYYFPALDSVFEDKSARLKKQVIELKADLDAAGMSKHVCLIDELPDYIDGKIDDFTYIQHKKTLDARDELNEQFKSLKENCKKYRAAYVEAQDSKTLDAKPYVTAICAVAKDAMERYAKSKERIGKVDYSDLEHGAFRVLSDGECMAEISRAVKYVFIDEFQDVNPLQSEIAAKFKNAGAEMFVVGDVKQSIYGFRRCSPAHFKRAMQDPDYTKISLADNFRSSEEVIDFINDVFVGVMTEEFGGVDYASDGEKLKRGNMSITGGSAKFVLTESENKKSFDEQAAIMEETVYSVVKAAQNPTEANAEARFIADSIVEYLATAEKPDLSSVAVLMRSTGGALCAELIKELSARGIKYDFGRKTSVKDFPEAVALIDILRVVDNRYDDVALYTALRSPMGGLSDSQLAEIAVEGEAEARRNKVPPAVGADRKIYAFWQKAEAYSGRYKERLDKFFKLRNEIALYAKSHDCADVLGYITSRTDYFGYVYETGGQAQAVEALIELAADKRCSASAFLSYFDKTDFELEAGGSGDAVTISTVHASKGLEYDFVIVADCAHRFNMRDNYGRVLVSEDGVAVKLPDATSRTLKKSAAWIVENSLAPDRLKQEELRLFYVALTRAKKKLVVCGKNKDYKVIDPKTAVRFLDFMKNVPPQAPDNPVRPIDDGQAEAVIPIDERIVSAVKARCEYRYEANALPIKTCVTALAHSVGVGDENGDYTVAAPVLTADEIDNAQTTVSGSASKSITENTGGVDARLRGTAYHRAMELIDFEKPDLAAVAEACEGFELVDGGEILRAANAMKKLTKTATFVAKERYFIVDLPSRGIYGDGAEDGNVLVQGVIDLLIADENGCVTIVDYKTGNPETLDNEGYRTQLRLYAAAVEKVTPYKVKRAMLYSFASGEFIEFKREKH